MDELEALGKQPVEELPLEAEEETVDLPIGHPLR
jgi:hypothetical protein